MKKEFYLLFLLIFLILGINYSSIDAYLIKNFDNSETRVVTRIIDGDTIEIGEEKIRLLGINSPEKGEVLSDEATKFLEENILNKTVRLKFEGDKFDMYKRELAYVYYKNKNINLESVRNGYSNYYFPKGKTPSYKKFKEAWTECLNQNKNLCEMSEEKCIYLENWDIKSQEVVIKNNCNKEINLEGYSIKDEGRKKYVFENKIINPDETITLTAEDWGKSYVWTKSGDSIFIRDKENKLIYFESY